MHSKFFGVLLAVTLSTGTASAGPDAVSSYAAREPVALGLEMYAAQTVAIRAYLAGDGSKKAKRLLLSTPFWHVVGTQHDGRRNYDALDLIDRVRNLRTQGRDVSILAFDTSPPGNADSQGRRPEDVRPVVQASGPAGDRPYRLEIVLPRFTVARLLGRTP